MSGVPYGDNVAMDTNTTYTVGDGGLTQNNFTDTLKGKLDDIADNANNYSLPATVSTNSKVYFSIAFLLFLIPFETFAAAVSEKRSGLADFEDFSPNLKFF